MLREKKVADSTRVNQPVCLTIACDFRPYAVDRLQLNKSGHSIKVTFVGIL